MWQLHWMINLIPDSFFIWITYLLFSLGIILYLASKLVVWIPVIAQYKIPAELVGVVLLIIGAYLFGSHDNEAVWQSQIKELEEQVKIAEEKSQQVNTIVQTKVITKVKVVKQNVYVNREIIREVAGRQLDASCTLPVSTVVLHDSASRNEVARGPGSTDGTPSTVKASELLDTVVVNYGTYYEVAEKLKGWQEWYRSQKAIFETLQK